MLLKIIRKLPRTTRAVSNRISQLEAAPKGQKQDNLSNSEETVVEAHQP